MAMRVVTLLAYTGCADSLQSNEMTAMSATAAHPNRRGGGRGPGPYKLGLRHLAKYGTGTNAMMEGPEKPREDDTHAMVCCPTGPGGTGSIQMAWQDGVEVDQPTAR